MVSYISLITPLYELFPFHQKDSLFIFSLFCMRFMLLRYQTFNRCPLLSWCQYQYRRYSHHKSRISLHLATQFQMKCLRWLVGPGPFQQYLGLCEMVANAWSESGVSAMVRLVAVAPTQLSSHYTFRMEWIRRFLVRGSKAGQVAALFFGVVAGQVTDW